MRQVIQSLKTGVVEVAEVPRPAVKHDKVLVKVNRSLISSGTERMLLQFGHSTLLGKARSQPDQVRKVLDKIAKDGFLQTYQAVKTKLDEPIALGYSSVGVILAIGADIEGYSVGQRVVCNGPHAEIVEVSPNYCVKVDTQRSDDEIVFSIVGAIALHGMRLSSVQLGSKVVVIGCGLIGLMLVQLLRAAGAQVLVIDPNHTRLELAAQFKARVLNPLLDDVESTVESWSEGVGVDVAYIAAATNSNEPIMTAGKITRKRGQIVVVGAVGLELDRSVLYKKEISVIVSTSYGPGRYDPEYERKNLDFPISYVRWTAGRNIQTIVRMIEQGEIHTAQLISEYVDIDQVGEAYERLLCDSDKGPQPLAILIKYSSEAPDSESSHEVKLSVGEGKFPGVADVTLGVLGAGSYAKRYLLPVIRELPNVFAKTLVSGTGFKAVLAAKMFKFSQASCVDESIFGDNDVNTVVIATPHDSHAEYVIKSLEAGKSVFVEKPLCLDHSQLLQIERAYNSSARSLVLMVGFNRRFSPLIDRIKKHLDLLAAPKFFRYTVNAGQIKQDSHHWVTDRAISGGRIRGELCHFIDLVCYLATSVVVNVSSTAFGRADSNLVQLEFANGSIAEIHYIAEGSSKLKKERLEIWSGVDYLLLDNFRKITFLKHGKRKTYSTIFQNKGQKECVTHFFNVVCGKEKSRISFDEIKSVTDLTLRVAESMELERVG